MHVSLAERWQGLIAGLIATGRYGSADDVVDQGLRLIAAQEAETNALRGKVQASLARGGHNTDEDLERILNARAEVLRGEGYEA